jgi:hypothetical protein
VSNYLFAKYDLRSVLQGQRQKMLAAIEDYAAIDMKIGDVEVLVSQFVNEFTIHAPELTEGAISVDVVEARVDVRFDERRFIRDRSRPALVPGIAATYVVPFKGDAALFECRPMMNAVNPSGTVHGSELHFRFERADTDVAATKQGFERELTEVRDCLQRVTREVHDFNETLVREAKPAVERRQSRLREMDSGAKALGIQIRPAANPARPELVKPARVEEVERRYDVALSFAGEDRDYVEKVATLLAAAGVDVFYDNFEKALLWGKNLVDHLADIYQHRSKYVVMFISEHYVTKAWPKHERAHAQARALMANDEYILPARFDDTEVPGLAGTVGYVDLRQVAPDAFVALVLTKLGRG